MLRSRELDKHLRLMELAWSAAAVDFGTRCSYGAVEYLCKPGGPSIKVSEAEDNRTEL